MKRVFMLMVAGVVCATAGVAPRAESPALKAAMREKVRNTQELIAPIVLGDSAGVKRYAMRLGRLTYAEVASWQSQPDSEYQRQVIDFLTAIEELGRAADQRNTRDASNAYAHLVASCVSCHQLVKIRSSASLTP